MIGQDTIKLLEHVSGPAFRPIEDVKDPSYQTNRQNHPEGNKRGRERSLAVYLCKDAQEQDEKVFPHTEAGDGYG